MKSGAKPQNMNQTLRRLFKYLSYRPLYLIFIVLLVIWGGFVNVYGIYQMRAIIDDYINVSVFDPVLLGREILKLGLFFASGVIATLIYNPLMVYYSQIVIKIGRAHV